ncbi:MAG TPA: hypothetical protein VK720_06370 [Terracidiphilus sp.]|jgi:hypothetical protein|nr:hypothetical protein [Terracidiphilus sp.]
MAKLKSLGHAIAICSIASAVLSASAQKLDATVLYRQNSDSDYRALIPGYSDPASPDCAADMANADCYRPTAESGPFSYDVVGTTLSLLLPDQKVAVINCVNKYSPKGTYIARRSCGMPLVEHVQAEFKGNIAKLEWPVGPDGKKTESEKYRVVAVLDKR